MINLFLLLLLLIPKFHAVLAGVATVYYPYPNPTPVGTGPIVNTILGTTRLTPMGTGENGRTKYDMEVVLSFWVQDIPNSLVSEGKVHRTIISETTTRTFALEENASQLILSASAPPYQVEDGVMQVAGIQQGCELDLAKMTGECVELQEIPYGLVLGSDGSPQSTKVEILSSTFTMSLFPLATFTVDSSGEASGLHGHRASHTAILLIGSVLLVTFLLGIL